MIPISEGLIQPIIRSNIEYVNSIDEFEQITLEPNQAVLCFDNYVQCFYIKKRDTFGEYSPTTIFFYNDFAQKVQSIEEEVFIEKCRKAGLDDLKTEIAVQFFIYNKTPKEVWLWLLATGKADWSWDYVKALKCTLKKKIYNVVI